MPLLLGVVLFCGSLSWWLICAPKADDQNYMHQFIGEVPYSDSFSMCEGELITTASQVWDSIQLHNRNWNNTRLGSALLYAFNLVPEWVLDLCEGVGFTAMFLLAIRLVLGRRWGRHPLACVCMAWLLWWSLPWHEFMLSSAFAINYVWGSALCLWFLLELSRGRLRLWSLCLLGLVASTMQEGIGFTMCFALLPMCLYKWVRRGWDTRYMVACLVFALGTCLVSFNPAVYSRSGNGSALFAYIDPGALPQFFIVKNWIVTLSVVVFAGGVCLMRGRARRSYLRFAFPYVLGAVAATILMLGTDPMVMRITWMADIMAVMVCMRQVVYMPRARGIWRRLVSPLAAVLLGLMAVWMIGRAVVQYRLEREIDKIMEIYLRDNEPVIFLDITAPYELPWWSLGLPLTWYDTYYSMSNHLYTTYVRDRMPADTDRRTRMIVVLSPLDSVQPLDSLPLLEGTAGVRQCYGEAQWSRRFMPSSFASFYYGDPDYDSGARGERLPWYALRQSLAPRPMRTKVSHYRTRLPVIPTEEMRRKGWVSADVDTIYFYMTDFFSIPRHLQGCPLIGEDE